MAEIRVKNLHFSYTENTEVLKGIDLILKGEPTAIIGQNGAGKSTFVKLLKGLLVPTAGEILLNGNNTINRTAASLAKEIGLVFQNPNDQIFKNKVIDEVMFGPLNIGISEQEAMENAHAALRKVRLEQHAEDNPYDLSLSDRKMVSIASILAMDTSVVIFDEPTMGQDAAGKELLKEIIIELKEEGKLVLCILHDMDFAAAVFPRTIVFNGGKVTLDGPAREVFASGEVLRAAKLEQPHIMQVARILGLEGIFLTEQELIAKVKGEF